MAPGETGGKSEKFTRECHRNDSIWLRAFWHATALCIRALRRCAMNAMLFDFSASVAQLFLSLVSPSFTGGHCSLNPIRGLRIQAMHNNVCESHLLLVNTKNGGNNGRTADELPVSRSQFLIFFFQFLDVCLLLFHDSPECFHFCFHGPAWGCLTG